MTDDLLRRVADHLGVVANWYDLTGTHHHTSPETQRALLNGMGQSTTDNDLVDYLAAIEGTDQSVPRYLVVEANVATPLSHAGNWSVTCEDGTVHAGCASDSMTLPALPTGYHTLTVGADRCLIVSAPLHAPSVKDVTGHDDAWGVTAALYALRSDRNVGLGDYHDLATLATTLGHHGADFVGINPVHALGAASDIYSPYSPSHRLFFDARHIALDQVPEFQTSDTARRLYEANHVAIEALRMAELIDYVDVGSILAPILKAMASDLSRHEAFDAFRACRGKALNDFCLYEAISEIYGPSWKAWPSALQSPATPAALAFAAEHADDLRVHAYTQWIAETQLANAQVTAKSAGMMLGLYTDLAVGVRPDGAETWANPGLFATGASLGVPPDYFNASGQMWGLAPFNPHVLCDADFRPFIDTIKAVIRHAGMIRIDHVIGLQRCFWVPEDAAIAGGYVRYPFDALMAIIRIEANRANCVVIGEDLGVVPDGFRDQMRDMGLYGCSVMQFERWDDQEFRHPQDFRRDSLASFGTHDTPTLRGFWQGRDCDERRRIGQIDDAAHVHQHQERFGDRYRLQRMTGMDGDVTAEDTINHIGPAVHGALAGGATILRAVQLDDITDQAVQPNMPGTIDEYPNWRVKNTIRVDALENSIALQQVSTIFGNRRASSPIPKSEV